MQDLARMRAKLQASSSRIQVLQCEIVRLQQQLTQAAETASAKQRQQEEAVSAAAVAQDSRIQALNAANERFRQDLALSRVEATARDEHDREVMAAAAAQDTQLQALREEKARLRQHVARLVGGGSAEQQRHDRELPAAKAA